MKQNVKNPAMLQNDLKEQDFQGQSLLHMVINMKMNDV